MSIRDCITSAVDDRHLDARHHPGAPEALVPSDHPAHHGGAEAIDQGTRPVLNLADAVPRHPLDAPAPAGRTCPRSSPGASWWCRGATVQGTRPVLKPVLLPRRDRQHQQAALAPAAHAHPPLTPATNPSAIYDGLPGGLSGAVVQRLSRPIGPMLVAACTPLNPHLSSPNS